MPKVVWGAVQGQNLGQGWTSKDPALPQQHHIVCFRALSIATAWCPLPKGLNNPEPPMYGCVWREQGAFKGDDGLLALRIGRVQTLIVNNRRWDCFLS